MIDELYSTRERRDERYHELVKSTGLQHKRYTVRNQQLHPEHVVDLAETPAGQDRGFGNTVYKTYFAVLYGVKEVRS